MFPKERGVWELEYIRNLVKFIAVENQIRGRDATGVVAFNKKGTKLFKDAQMARKFVSTDTYQRFADEAIKQDTHSVLIHTRAGTKGHESNNDNNHPIDSRHFIGVHNGMIYNDDELFDKEDLFRLAEVDSEIIFRLHDKYGDSIDGIIKAAEKLQGGFTYSFASKKNRHLLYLVRNNNPVVMVFIPELNIIAFASEKRFLDSAITAASLEFGYEAFISASELVWCHPSAETIMVFDTTQDNAFEQLRQQGHSFKASSINWSSRDEDWEYDETYGWIVKYKSNYVKKNRDSESTIRGVFDELEYDTRLLIEEFVEIEKDRSWNEGWSAGRASLEDNMRYAKGLAYENGFEKGKDKGYDEGWIDAKSGVSVAKAQN